MKTFPLSSSQQALYMQYKQRPQDTIFNIPLLLNCSVRLEKQKLVRCIEELASQHIMLSARIIDGMNMVGDFVTQVDEIDLSGDALQPYLNEKMILPFDLSQAPLIRFYLIHSDDHSTLFIVYHHIITDDLPPAFIQALEDNYFNQSTVQVATKNYENFIAEEQTYLISNNASADQLFLQQQVTDLPVCDLGLLAIDKSIDSGKNVGHHKHLLPKELFAAIKSRARQSGVSPYVVFTTALQLLLHKYTGQKDLLIGSVINNRYQKGFAGVLGDFTNIMLLRSRVTDIRLEQLLKVNFKLIVAAMQHGSYPFYEFARRQETELLQVAIVYHYLSELDNLQYFSVDFSVCQAASLPLIVEVLETGVDATIFFKYQNEYFNAASIERIADHYSRILELLIAGNDTVDTLSLLSAAEYDLVKKINQTDTYFPADKCIHELFEEVVLRLPNAIAIQCNQQTISYLELNQRANQLAHYLQSSLQITPDMIIALHLDKSIEAYIAIIAILKTGACYLPLDPTYPDERIKIILQLASPKLIISKVKLHNNIKTVFLNDVDVSQYSLDNLQNPSSAKNLAYIIYTSGTTGRPNGVAVEHQGMCNLAFAQGREFGVNTASKVLQFASLSFDASVSEMWTTLLLGGQLCLPWLPTQLMGDGLANLLDSYGIEIVTLPPSILSTLPVGKLKLKTLIVAGEAASTNLLEQWHGHVDTLLNAYGPTEATVCATMQEFHPGNVNNDIGYPIENVQTYILDDNLQLQPIGIIGEIYIGGAGIARGYLNNPELTAKKFIPNPLDSSTVLYKTGDKGCYLNTGAIQYHGRVDTQIKLRGFRIEIEEIENSISSQPEIKSCAVAIDPNDPRIICFVIPQDVKFSVETLKHKVASVLPKYMLPHQYIVTEHIPLSHNGKIDRKQLLNLLVPINESRSKAGSNSNETSSSHGLKAGSDSNEASSSHGLNGGSDYNEASSSHGLNGTFDSNEASSSHGLTVGSSSKYKFIHLCAEVLKLPTDKIDLTQDFFSHGGDSLSLLRLSHKIKTQLNVELNIETIFDANSLNAILDNVTTQKIITTSDNIENDLKIKINKPADCLPAAATNNILLTGATGFLGIHLLERLLIQTTSTIYCLVRGESYSCALQKLQHAWKHYHGSHLNTDRVILVKGDLSQPDIGLSPTEFAALASKIATIYHCGAEVNHLYTYSMLRAANVLSVIQLMKFAAIRQLKHIHYISTIDTVTSSPQYFDSEAAPLESLDVEWGYIQSKWVSETLLYKNEIPFTVFRVGNITGNTKTGISNPEKNHALLLMKTCIQSGVSPDWENEIEMTPVDVLSEMLVKLSLLKTADQRTFYNLHNPHPLTWAEYISIINTLGYPIEYIPYQRWVNEYVNQLTDEHPLFAFKDIYQGSELAKLSVSAQEISSTRTKNILNSVGLSHATDYPALIDKYMQYFNDISFINRTRLTVT